MVRPELIEQVEQLRRLNRAAREELASRAVARRFARGTRLWSAGTEPRGLFVILEGRVRIVRTVGRRQHVLHTEGPGATLGEVPLFAGGNYPASAIAAEATTCLVIDRSTLRIAIAADPSLAWMLLAQLATRVRHLVDRLSSQTADPVSARLAAYLLARPRRASGEITLGCTQQQVAEEIGTVREVVVRLLRQWVDAGVLRPVGRGAYVIADTRRLQLSPVAVPSRDQRM